MNCFKRTTLPYGGTRRVLLRLLCQITACITSIQVRQWQQHKHVHAVKFLIPGWLTANPGSASQISFNKRWNLVLTARLRFASRKCQMWGYPVFGRRKMGFCKRMIERRGILLSVGETDAGASCQV